MANFSSNLTSTQSFLYQVGRAELTSHVTNYLCYHCNIETRYNKLSFLNPAHLGSLIHVMFENDSYNNVMTVF